MYPVTGYGGREEEKLQQFYRHLLPVFYSVDFRSVMLIYLKSLWPFVNKKKRIM